MHLRFFIYIRLRMASTFTIPLLNPFNFTQVNQVVDARYNKPNVPEACYNQQWQTNDTTMLQVLSANQPTITFFDNNDVFAKSFTFSPAPVQVVNVDFSVWETVIDFSLLSPGQYYAIVSTIDGSFRSSWINLQTIHPETVLFQYDQPDNDLGVVFETGIQFSFRVDGYVGDYQPGSTNEQFIDQRYEPVPESSYPFNKNVLNLGTQSLLPEWIMQLLNGIFAVENKQIDGIYYERESADSQIELTRQPGQRNTIGKINIIPRNNVYSLQYDSGTNQNVIVADMEPWSDAVPIFTYDGTNNVQKLDFVPSAPGKATLNHLDLDPYIDYRYVNDTIVINKNQLVVGLEYKLDLLYFL